MVHSHASPTRKSPVREHWAALVALGAVLLFTAIVLGDMLNPRLRAVADGLASAGAALVAAALALRAARAQSGRMPRASWLCFGVALLAWAFGDGVRSWSELMYGVTPSPPSLVDLAHLTVLPLAIAGVLLRPSRRPQLVSRRILLIDTVMAMSAVLAIAWALVLGPILEGVSASRPMIALALAYPIGDLIMLCCLVVAILREAEGGPATAPLLGALALLTAGDAIYAALAIQSAYVSGHPVDVVWFGSLALFGLAASRERVDVSLAQVHGLRSSARRVPSLRMGMSAARHGPFWRYATPLVLLTMATLVMVIVSAQRGVPPGAPVRLLLGLAWLMLLVRVSFGFKRAAEGQRRERQLRVGHATSFRREQQRRRQLEAIRDVTTELTRELDLTALLTLITRRTASLVDAPIGIVYIWDDSTERLIPRAWHGLDSWFAEIQPGRGEGAAGRVVELGRGVIVNDYPTARERYKPLLCHTPIEAALAAPIISQGKLLGVISAADARAGRTFEDGDLRLLELFADQAAVAIEHARLVDEAASVEALRELSRLKTELLSTVSHELRTPLTLIHGYAELLHARAHGLTPDDVQMMAEEVLLGSRTMIRLVDDLLDFSRLDGARLHLDRVRIDVADLLRRHVQAWRGQPGGDRLQLEAISPLEIYADVARLDQVIRNLISNALNHAPTGPIMVRARHDPGWIWLEVEDQGPGIPEDEIPRIWESFFRGERARNSPNRGSGLGLAVVRQLVELHRGKVEVKSTVGVGTAFRVWLPSAPPNGRVDHEETMISSSPSTSVVHLPKRSEGE